MTALNSLIYLDTCRYGSGNEEDYGHRFCELFEESYYKRFFFCFNKLVFAVFLKSLGSFFFGKAVISAFKSLKNILFVFFVEFHLVIKFLS